MKTNTYMNFAKRIVMVLAIGLMAVNAWAAYSETFSRISNVSELSSGDSVMLVLQNGLTTTVGLAIKEGANNANCQSVVINDGPAITCTTNTLVWKVTITAGIGSNPDTYVFTRGNDTKCIGWKANTDVYCNKSTTSTDLSASSWTITKLSDGYFEIQSTGTGNRYITRGTSDVFKAYATSNFVNQMTLDPRVTLAANHGAMSIYKKGTPCDKSVSIATDGTCSNATIKSSSTNSLYTCSDTEGSREVTITITPATGYTAVSSDRLTFTGSATEPSYVSGPTADGSDYKFVYRYAKSATGTSTVGVSLSTLKTYTVTCAISPSSYGTVSHASIENVQHGTSISALGNVLSVGNTDVTATPADKTADYKYSFINWTNLPAGGQVTGNVTITANFSQSERTYTNYRTRCCTPLAAPANIAVSVTGAATATVTWDAVTDATGYEYKLGDGEWTDTEVAGNVANPELSMSGLTGATNYTIYLRANGSGDNCAEGEASVGTDFKTYSTISAEENDALMGTAKVSLDGTNWYDAVEAADGTTIYLQATAASALYEFSNWATPSSGSISSNQLTGWEGDVTVTANFQTQSLTELEVPEGMGLVGTAGAISATIKWNVVGHASSYLVTCAGATVGEVSESDGIASCELTGLSAYTEYTWNVQAIGDGVSYKSSNACADQNFTTDKKKPTAIEITHEPTKTTYVEGEMFDATGMVVVVSYNTDENDAVYTITPSTALTYGMTFVTLTASLNEAEVTTTQAITVLKKYTLTFMNNGVEVSHKDLYEGAAYGELESALLSSAACDEESNTFRGWSTSEIGVKTNTAPTYAQATDVMPANDVVLNAVWAKQTGHEGYDLVTSPTSGKKYIFVSSNTAGSAYAVAATSVSTSTTGGTTAASALVTISSGNPVYIGTVNENLEFAFDGSDYGIVGTLDSDITKKYLHINGSYVARRTASDADITWNNDKGLEGHTTGKTVTYRYLYLNGTVFDKAETPAGNARVYAFEKQEISYGEYITHCIKSAVTIETLAHGSEIIVKKGNDDVASGNEFAPGVALTITTEAASGYRVDNLRAYKTGDTNTPVAITDGVLTMPAYPITITAEETAVYPVSVAVAEGQSTWGSVTIDGVAGPAYVNEDDKPEIVATPNAGYRFKEWTVTTSGSYELGDKSLTDASIAPQVSAEATFTATFAEKAMTGLTLSSNAMSVDLANGTTSLSVTGYTPSDLLDAKKTVNWSSSDETVATVSGGSITLKKAGTTTITAAWTENESVKAECALNVYQWNFVNYTVAPTPETEYTDADQFDKSAYAVTANYVRSDDNNEHNAVELDADDWTVKLGETEISDTHDFVAGNTGDNGKELAFYVGESKVWYSDVTVTEVAKDQFIDGLWGETFTLMTGTYDMPTPQAHTAGSTDCLKHNTFAGWVLAAKADNPTVDDLVTTTTDVTAANNTYYAVWSKSENVNKDFTVSKNSFASGDNGLDASVNIGTDISYCTQKNGGTSNPAVVSGPVLRLYKLGSNQSYGGSITISAVSGASLKKVEMTVSYATYKYIKNTYTTTGLQDGTITDGKIVLDNISSNNLTIVNVGSTQLDISKIEVTYTKTVTEIDYITDCDPRYDVEFLAGTGATGSYDKVTKKAGVEITLPDGTALSKDHHTFAGWYSAHYDVTYSESTSMVYTVPVDGETLVAQWNEDHHALVHFMNGESEIAGSPIKVYDDGLYNLAGAPSESGKEFLGWRWNGSMYTAGQQNQHMSETAEDRTYVAVWMPVIDVATIASADLSDGKWILVQNKSQLKAGDFIVIAAAGSAKALSNNQKTSNRGDAAVTKIADTLTYTTNVAPLFLQYDPENDYYAFYDRAYTTNTDVAPSQKGYLYAPNALKTQTGITMQGIWAIDIADKKASIVAQGNNSDKIMRYNKGSNLFNCYGTATQSDIAIYKWAKNISSDMNVSDVTNTDIVIVKNDVTLTINDAATLDNVIVEAGGNLELNGDSNKKLTVNNLTINSEAGKSGQVMGTNVQVGGDLVLEIKLAETLDPTMYYCISAPFAVSAFEWGNGTPMVFNQDYQLFKYDGDKRARTGNGWQRVGATMEANTAYFIIFNYDPNKYKENTIRLKAANKTIPNLESLPMAGHSYEQTESKDQNWNGLGNPTLHYVGLDKTVSVFEAGQQGFNPWVEHDNSNNGFVVGTAFFVKGTGTLSCTETVNGTVRAPRREGATNYTYCVEIAKENANRYDNRLYVMASETASTSFEEGKDLPTLNSETSNYGALIWTKNYGMRLAVEEAPMVNSKATYDLGIFAPSAGTYTISVAAPKENATLYLTKNGRIYWNLTMGACELELAQGQNNEYGLVLRAEAPAVTTGIENGELLNGENGVQKVVIDEHVYILRGGEMYDMTGKAVK